MKKFVLILLSILSLGLVGGSVAAISACVSNSKKKEDSSEKTKSPDIFIYEDDDTSNTFSIPEDADMTKLYLGYKVEKDVDEFFAPEFSMGIYSYFCSTEVSFEPLTSICNCVPHYISSANHIELVDYTFYDCSDYIYCINEDNNEDNSSTMFKVELTKKQLKRKVMSGKKPETVMTECKACFFPTKPGIYACTDVTLPLLSLDNQYHVSYDFFYCAKESSL